jgi:hypothetical protein
MRTLKSAGKTRRTLEDKLRKTPQPLDRAKLDALCGAIGALPVFDARSPDEILGYDAVGIPR